MATFYTALMPSGFAIRLREYTTRHEIMVSDRVEKMKGGEAVKNRETLIALLDAIAPKVEIVRSKQPVLDKNGAPMLDENKAPIERDAVDVDATIGAIDPKRWIKCTPESLMVEGEGNFYSLFKSPIDFGVALRVVSRIVGNGVDLDLLEGKAVASANAG